MLASDPSLGLGAGRLVGMATHLIQGRRVRSTSGRRAGAPHWCNERPQEPGLGLGRLWHPHPDRSGLGASLEGAGSQASGRKSSALPSGASPEASASPATLHRSGRRRTTVRTTGVLHVAHSVCTQVGNNMARSARATSTSYLVGMILVAWASSGYLYLTDTVGRLRSDLLVGTLAGTVSPGDPDHHFYSVVAWQGTVDTPVHCDLHYNSLTQVVHHPDYSYYLPSLEVHFITS